MFRNCIIICTISLTIALNSFAQSAAWLVTAEDSKVKNVIELSPKNIATGKNIFTRSCVACHGLKADGKGLIQSANLLTDSFQSQSDGAIFYKINTGRNKMPPFKGVLKDEDIWSVVDYLRVLVKPSLMPAAKDLKLELTTNEEQKSLTAFVLATDSVKQALAEVDIHFYVKRDFGLMPIGSISNYTNKDGKVKVYFPEKVIGDTLGNVLIIAKVENNFLYNDAETSISRKWGTVLKTEDEKFNQRALWGSRSKSPIWLLLLANGIILAVWGVIIYVIFNLFRIKKAGRIFIK